MKRRSFDCDLQTVPRTKNIPLFLFAMRASTFPPFATNRFTLKWHFVSVDRARALVGGRKKCESEMH
jgi:hypothetical protein